MLEINKIHLMDCLEGMAQMEPESVDLIVTDPPYGIGYESFADGREIANDSYEDWNRLYMKWIEAFFRVLKVGCCCCVFGAGGGGSRPVMVQFTVDFVKQFHYVQTVIWDKRTIGLGMRYRGSFETIVIGSKGKNWRFYDTSKRLSNIFRETPPQVTAEGHPTPKPIPLIEKLIRIHSKEGDLVLDPFMGGGTTAVAAKNLDRNFIGFEIMPEYLALAQKRLSAYENSLFDAPKHTRHDEGKLLVIFKAEE